MASNDVKECRICNEEYNEDERCPRVLPCSHTLCSLCIVNLISRNSKTCPFCRLSFTARTARDIRVNVDFSDALKLLKEIEQKPLRTHSNRLDYLKREAEEIADKLIISCQNTEQEIDRILVNNKQLQNLLISLNENLKVDILKHIDKMITINISRVQYLCEYSKRLENQRKNVIEKRKEVQETKASLLAPSKNRAQVCMAADAIENMRASVLQRLQSFENQLSEEERTNNKLQLAAAATSDIVTILRDAVSPTRKTEQAVFTPLLQNMKIQEIPLQQISSEMLQNLSPMIKKLLSVGRIYAIQERNGSRKYAKLSISGDNQILLHCLRNYEPPSDVCMLTHRSVLRLKNPSSSMAFLEIGTQEKTLGRIYISLTTDTKRAQNFLLLCTGKIGPSYLHTNIIEARKGDNNVVGDLVFGDYENNDGTGGKTLVPGTGDEEGALLRQPFLSGLVVGWRGEDSLASKFRITLDDNPNWSLRAVFGRVESGLQVLTLAVARYPNIRTVRITDCGVVISR